MTMLAQRQYIRISPFVAMQPWERLAVLGLFATYCVVVVGLASFRSASGLSWIIPSLLLFVFARTAPLFFYRPEYGWFHPLIFGALTSLLSLLRSLPAYAFGLHSHVALPEYAPDDLSGLLAFHLVLETLGVLAFYVGFAVCPRASAVGSTVTFRTCQGLPVKVLATLAGAAIVFGLFIYSRDGLTMHFLSLGSRKAALAGQFVWLTLIGLGAFACLIWLAMDPRVVWSPLFWGCSIVALLMVFLSGGGRGEVVFLVIQGVLVWMLRERRIAIVPVAAVGLTAFVAIQAMGELRRSSWTNTGTVDWVSSLQRDPMTYFEDVAESEFVQRRTTHSGVLPILARVPGDVDLLYGDSYLALLTVWIPRMIWPEKPGLIDGRVGLTFFNTEAAIPAGPIGEAYWNFHVPGILIVFGLAGAFHRRWSDFAQRHALQPGAELLHVITLWNLLNPGSAGLLGYAMAAVPTYVLLRMFGGVSRRRLVTTTPGHLIVGPKGGYSLEATPGGGVRGVQKA